MQVGNWAPIFIICGLIAVVFIGFGGAAIAYSIKTIYDNSKAYGLFARCYQCAKNYERLLTNNANGL